METALLSLLLFILLTYFLFISYKVINKNLLENFGSDCLDFIPFKAPVKYEVNPDKIFVSIASYRDEECSKTVFTIFDKAKNPENIYLGICEQNKDSTERCYIEELFENHGIKDLYKNIRYHNFNYKDAKGPAYARYFCSKLWQGEEYFLQIDSHTFFEKDWDFNLINMLKECKKESNKPVLSAYPPTEEQLKSDGFSVMDNGKFNKNDMPVFLAGIWSKWDLTKSIIRSPKPFYAAGFIFTYGSFLNEVPYDPNLSNLFQGEEVLFSARMFTHGYDLFAPGIKVCSHHYYRKEMPKVWSDVKNYDECRILAEKKVQFLLGLVNLRNVAEEYLKDINKYGLGKFRSLEDFWSAGGIDIENKTVENWNEDSNNKSPWNFYSSGFEKIKKFD